MCTETSCGCCCRAKHTFALQTNAFATRLKVELHAHWMSNRFAMQRHPQITRRVLAFKMHSLRVVCKWKGVFYEFLFTVIKPVQFTYTLTTMGASRAPPIHFEQIRVAQTLFGLHMPNQGGRRKVKRDRLFNAPSHLRLLLLRCFLLRTTNKVLGYCQIFA